jgi:hypothetical protein
MLNGIISYLTAKCRGNVHAKGLVEITVSSNSDSAWNVANLDDENPWTTVEIMTNYWSHSRDDYYMRSNFCSENEPDEWICWDFKILRIEPAHYTIQTGPDSHLKSWAVEGSDDGASWTEIDRGENKSHLNEGCGCDFTDNRALVNFAVSRSGSFRMIRLRQIGPNHSGDDVLVLGCLQIFGAVAGRQ